MLAGLSTEAAEIINPDYVVNPTANYYFYVCINFFIAITGTFITERIVEPRLGKFTQKLDDVSIDRLNKKEKKGLLWAFIVSVFIIAVILLGTIPSDGFFRSPDGSLLESPLIKDVIALLFLTAGLTGLAYGFGSGKFKTIRCHERHARFHQTLSMYIVLVFLLLSL